MTRIVSCGVWVGLICCVGLAQAQPVALIKKATSPITIDGVADEAAWADANVYADFFLSDRGPLTDDENMTSDEDLSGNWKALWDEENLYVYIEVTDDAYKQDSPPANAWEDDSIEIYLDGQDLDITDYLPEQGDWPIYQLTYLARTGDIITGINSANWPGGEEGAATYDGPNYTMEISLPWASIQETPENLLEPGEFGFGIAINDDDDPEEPGDAQIMWATEDGTLWQDASKFPSVSLVPGDVSPVVLGDVNLDTEVNGLDVDPFVGLVTSGEFQAEGDMNGDGVVNGLDVDPFVEAVVGGGVAAVPEPATLVLLIGSGLVLLGLAAVRRRRSG